MKWGQSILPQAIMPVLKNTLKLADTQSEILQQQ